ncbi:hypothetical protein N781_00760 [Pontibacillus halophilus JSM 076056 = DSM 19796]|uniref:Uncharacterized protein n=1 Tax=Pontibacillus halophilus JSM 076056 = DSM 19796 TaxID=1385510 RepID=A0A0A5GSE7_9BACI|nr:hypothetical protein [Pontibacillus halophilus]KGX94060.1 hypothetical protein N781_00760 [Pontibacillus halophilus JSM 076056 = DSM 19796]
MDWTPEHAFRLLQDVYTDEVMQQEKRRVFRDVYRHTKEHLEDLGVKGALSDSIEDRLKLYKEFTFMPGENLFQSMRYVFLLARGEKEFSRADTQQHLKRIYRALFSAASLKNPNIPGHFWDTPLGVACLIAENGIEAAYPILEEFAELVDTHSP